MDLETVANIMDEVLKGILEEKIYPYPRGNKNQNRKFGVGNKVASGSLRDSIEVVPKITTEGFTFQLFANDYFQWVQSGRAPGKKPVPINAILDWMSQRGIFATGDIMNVKYKVPQSRVAITYIINKARIKKGKKPIATKVLLDWLAKKESEGQKVVFDIDPQKSMAFAIQRNIVKFGINPANIEDKLYERLEADTKFEEALGDVLFEDFVNSVEYIFKETKIQVI